MRITYFFILFIIISCSTQKKGFEEYDDLLYTGLIEYKDQEYKSALNHLEQAIEILPKENEQSYFYAAAAAFHLNQDEKAKNLLKSALENTYINQDYFNNFEEFIPFKNKAIFNELDENFSKNTKTFYSNLEHPEIFKELDSLLDADQKVRTDGSTTEEMAKIDSTNIVRLIEITKKYGWQDKGQLLLWHQRGNYKEQNWVWNYFKPFINKEIERGKIRKSFWVQYEEFENVINEKYQLYGMYPQNYDMFPLKDPKNVDKRRDSLGLQPLWVMNKIYDWPLPENYDKNYSL
ncbi:hypothetical protein [Christiangramia forsetii]|uniref:Protein containing tetratricopeptide repeats n=2 Tax=Christiangramia forsetii TaxID=411153 RepID=A0LZT5_CHRFK|nr:hypothetical protein [Christiangramia forsetii]GGG46608.1 hypothetical protein GCM10011532_33140 [Christiangramia forsetii]CAL65880.1 protein containing tetratricopeptide repeats [Christiangramia forsetii KT0803]